MNKSRLHKRWLTLTVRYMLTNTAHLDYRSAVQRKTVASAVESVLQKRQMTQLQQ